MKYYPSLTLRSSDITSIRKELIEEFTKLTNPIFDDNATCETAVKGHFGYPNMEQFNSAIQTVFSPENDENWLGSYSPMQSPGKIRLNRKLILKLSYHILCENLKHPFSNRKLNSNDAKRILSSTFRIVLTHELFHYFCDVMIPFDTHKSTYFIAQEEALAVAISYCYNNPTNWNGNLNRYYFKELFFDKLTSPGYRDWINYKEIGDFYVGVLNYIEQPQSNFADYAAYNRTVFHDLENPSFLRLHILISSIVSSPHVNLELVG
jgi:hypothetical protein